MSVYRITLQENQIVIGTQPEYTFTMGDSASQQFATNNPYPKWKSITEKP